MFVAPTYVHNQVKVIDKETQKAVRSNGYGLDQLGHTVELLSDKVTELSLINRALWSILAKEQNLTGADLLQAVEALRRSDKATKSCKACGTTLQQTARKCYSCAHGVKLNSVFDVI